MAYRVYIKDDYKSEVVWVEPASRRLHTGFRSALVSGLLLSAVTGFFFFERTESDERKLQTDAAPATVASTAVPAQQTQPQQQPASVSAEQAAANLPRLSTHAPSPSETITRVETASDWLDIKVSHGDNMAQIFNRQGLSARDLHAIMSSHEAATALKRLRPGQVVSLKMAADELRALRFELDLTRTLLSTRQAGVFTTEIITVEPDTRVQQAQGVINGSLYLAGRDAGLSDRLLMQLIDIYGWDIDYRLDIRKGDSFRVIYEEIFRDQEKVAEGNILAAEFSNQGRSIRTVRFERANGQAGYFTDDGANMRKAFIRNPLDFGRISSHFNLKRKHPVLNRIRAHKGVDYAAATGTPIKATGDGKVQFIGNKGGYGKTIILKHGEKYSTLYAHLSRFGKSLKRGQPVRQGQVIGYVGSTGLATGPHLHYEFRMDGVHRNPVTVPLPQADRISAAEADDFRIRSAYLLTLLDTPDSTLLAQYDSPPNNRL